VWYIRLRNIRIRRLIIRGRGELKIYRGDPYRFDVLHRFIIAEESVSRSVGDRAIAIYTGYVSTKLDSFRSGYTPLSPGMVSRSRIDAGTIIHEYAHHVYEHCGDIARYMDIYFNLYAKRRDFSRIMEVLLNIDGELLRRIIPDANIGNIRDPNFLEFVSIICSVCTSPSIADTVCNGSELLARLCELYYKNFLVYGSRAWRDMLSQADRLIPWKSRRVLRGYTLVRIINFVFKHFARTMFLVIGSVRFIERVQGLLEEISMHIPHI